MRGRATVTAHLEAESTRLVTSQYMQWITVRRERKRFRSPSLAAGCRPTQRVARQNSSESPVSSVQVRFGRLAKRRNSHIPTTRNRPGRLAAPKTEEATTRNLARSEGDG